MYTRTHVHSLQANRQREEYKETGQLLDYPTLLPGFGKMTRVKPGPIYFLLLFILLRGVKCLTNIQSYNQGPCESSIAEVSSLHSAVNHTTQYHGPKLWSPDKHNSTLIFFLKMSSTCYLFKGKKKLTSYCLSASRLLFKDVVDSRQRQRKDD